MNKFHVDNFRAQKNGNLMMRKTEAKISINIIIDYKYCNQ